MTKDFDLYAFYLFTRIAMLKMPYFFSERTPYDIEFEFLRNKFQLFLLSPFYADESIGTYEAIERFISAEKDVWIADYHE